MTLFIGLVFAPIAALCAYIIVFSEYLHHYPNNKEPKRLAFQAGLMTYTVLMIISGAMVIALPYVVK